MHDEYRTLAAAALAAVAPADETGAVERVLDLARAIEHGEVGPLNQDLVGYLIRVAVTNSAALAASSAPTQGGLR
jgi:hypothetical protein